MRPAYPTANIYGQLCLPLDLELARLIISVKSVQTEMYKAGMYMLAVWEEIISVTGRTPFYSPS